MRTLAFAALAALPFLTSCAPVADGGMAGDPPPRARQCFGVRQVDNFEQGRPDQVFLRVGRNDVYELNAAGGCPDMDFANSRETLKQMGITLGAEVDDLFVKAQLPDGWTKRATDHAMWSDLLDEQGRRRAAIFYKAAFYDRSAHMSLCLRYRQDCYEPCDDGYSTVVKDGKTTLHVIGVREKGDYRLGEEHNKQALAWLDSHYPDWKDPLAYWG